MRRPWTGQVNIWLISASSVRRIGTGSVTATGGVTPVQGVGRPANEPAWLLPSGDDDPDANAQNRHYFRRQNPKNS
jgi:hypothetical protein